MATVAPYQLGNPLSKVHAEAADGQRQHAAWSPYDDNGGTVVAVAGEDYCIVAASTRMSTGFSILTRDASMLLQLTDKVVIASAGMQADRKALHKLLQHRNVMYQHNHGRPMSVSATAQLLSNTLYLKRFFPFYTFNLCAGLDEQGRGAVYNYDAIGSYERSGYFCQGSGKELIQPVLDNQLKAASPLLLPPRSTITALPLDQALDLVKDAFVSAGERDIYTGDKVEILIITKDGTRRDELQLKLD
ncbi:Proteasome subunit beta type-1 [Pleodorina starrii]|uniref:Proteasome subunit beta type-1 n=1 Tax=Pleodorina starrii TaxID=330485 RepID=A0A9W6F7D1_9CHLO|nr:Proteasome subunit beta type-1 [Pleodorina starrii]GLC59053.1 Proteasome subunit beta type-1 [Pleodorina starrii]GLC77122.1 Proteasome subunit beta type-1 [Pleodorina starrii]